MASTPFQDFPATTNSQWLIGQVFLFGVGPSEAQQHKNRLRNTVKAIQKFEKKLPKKDGLPWLGLGVHGVHCPQPCSNHRITVGDSSRAAESPHREGRTQRHSAESAHAFV